MVWNVIAWWFNGVERQLERLRYAELHKTFYEMGYVNQASFYGTLAVPYDGKHVQARIEVISVKQFTQGEIILLYQLFTTKPIDREYTLYFIRGTEIIEVKI